MLIAESGSTKTEWRLLEDGEVIRAFRSPGINPNVLTRESIEEILATAFKSNLSHHSPAEVFFYGAGVRGAAQTSVMQNALGKFFPKSKTYVELDILAAARSTQRPEGIICILGTGSNSAHHKAQQLLQIRGGLGFLFGDEGSGMDLGRHLIKGLLQEDFPESVKDYVERNMGKSISQIRLDIHHSAKPNVQMAALSKLLPELQNLASIREMIIQRFIAFLDTTVCRYADYSQVPVDFVGSVSFFFQEQLQEACKARSVQLGTVVKDPVEKLVEFHRHWSP